MLEWKADIPTTAVRRRVDLLRIGSRMALGTLALLIAVSAAAQTAVHIHDVLRTPGSFNGHDVAIFGRVRELMAGPHYATFKICGGQCLNVLVWGHPRISDGQALSVRGRFHILKEIDHQKIHNMIEVEHGTL